MGRSVGRGEAEGGGQEILGIKTGNVKSLSSSNPRGSGP